nr:ATP-binding cassette domain-containing protein [Actinomycetota bacterium]
AGVSKDEIGKRVKEAAKILDLEPYLDRKPKALSGGQRQRVAMGRAIVRSPQVFLMDEPLSNLDAKLRVQTRTQIASLQRRLGVTTVYVTHDQVEAMTMGDRVAVLKDGLLQQCDSPRRMYDHPDNVFVAGFIGSPAMNLLDVPVTDGGVKFGDAVLPIAREDLKQAGSHVTVGVRPEDLDLTDSGKGLAVTVEVVEELGADAYIYGQTKAHTIDVGGDEDLASSKPFIARVDGRRPPEKGSVIHLAPRQGHLHMFSAENGERIGG